MRSVMLAACFAVLVPDRGPVGPAEMPTPQEQILGDWQQESVGGQNVAKRFAAIFRVTREESIFMIDGKVSAGDGLTGNYKIDWSANPVAIDFMPRRGGAPLHCILKLDGDRLTLALPLNGGVRPRGFAAPELAGNLIVHHRRVKN
jgi:uncharacterized protein (TIGR03067 family)